MASSNIGRELDRCRLKFVFQTGAWEKFKANLRGTFDHGNTP
jgi:hypothetical protein